MNSKADFGKLEIKKGPGSSTGASGIGGDISLRY